MVAVRFLKIRSLVIRKGEKTIVRQMFQDVVDPSVHVGSSRKRLLPLSILAALVIIAVIVGSAIIGTLLATDKLPEPRTPMGFVLEVFVPPQMPGPENPAKQPAGPPTNNPPAPGPPVDSPTELPPVGSPEPPAGPPGPPGPPGGGGGGTDGPPMGPPVAIPGPPPVDPPPPKGPVVVGGKIKPPSRIKDAVPVYPLVAHAARVSGTVTIQAIIGKDGKVKDAKAVGSIPLLDQAALDAVRQWLFTPTLLNDVPVEVIMTVKVNFALR